MLTWNESSSSRSADVSVNKVIEAMESMRKSYFAHCASFLARYSWEPVRATIECAYAWLLNWANPEAQHSMPISRCFKAHKRESQKSPRHFFSAQKLNMRNAP
jgi:hypothetical protein